ncbi:PASTA domain-containing protein, partial [Streptomyces flavofungini]|uniref:PASTA domain-containing protein n=1 Tax=Streptomyces flavofungini TaxID=68200 RepID=UPI0034E03F6A
AIGGLITAISLNGDDGNKEATDDKSKQPVAGHKGPDRNNTVETEKCTEPETAYNDENKIKVPDFTFKDWKSVLSCLQAAGWGYDKRPIDENAYGQDTVMRQTPKEGTEIDPKNVEIQFDISTGDPA